MYETKILGLSVDGSFSFNKHAEKITGLCIDVWKEVRIYRKTKTGHSRNTLVLLYKILIIPTLLYSASVWANKKTKKLKIFQSFVSRDTLETSYCPNAMATEVLMVIPPIDIVVHNISAKFLLKVLHYHDHLRKRVIQQHERRFLTWF